jgi:hypothetical protein
MVGRVWRTLQYGPLELELLGRRMVEMEKVRAIIERGSIYDIKGEENMCVKWLLKFFGPMLEAAQPSTEKGVPGRLALG